MPILVDAVQGEVAAGPTLHLDELAQTLRVERFRGREGLSTPYRFDVTVRTTRRIPLTRDSLLGRPATLRFGDSAGRVRVIRGVIDAQRVVGALVEGDALRYRVRLVPRFALARRRVQSRIFQERTVVEIAGLVLNRARVPLRAKLAATYPALEYAVQHRESDLGFVARILAEHGIWYVFEHPDDPPEAEADLTELTQADLAGFTVDGLRGSLAGGGRAVSEELVLRDAARGYGPDLGALRFAREQVSETLAAADVTAFDVAARVRPTRVSQRGFDFVAPLAPVEHAARTDDPTRADARDVVERLGLELALHRDEYQRPTPERRAARVELERARADALESDGASVVAALAPAARFTLEDHPAEELNRPWTVVEVLHEGAAPELVGEQVPLYRNRFRAIPAEVEYRPAVSRRRPSQVLETATVVGPQGEDVHTDALGRVRVRFHWDRAGEGRDDASCWIRVAQSQAGAGFGAQHLPRVGSEVVVGFLDGDPDRPVVLGALYNGPHPTPFALPEDRTRSGLRTRSVGGADGYNELSFEDRSGAEQVRLRAQRDLAVQVLSDRHAVVGGADRLEVHGVRAESLGEAQTEVRGDRRERVGGDRSASIVGSDRVAVGGNATAEVSGHAELSVGASLRAKVDHDLTATAGRNVSVAASENAFVRAGVGGEPSMLVLNASTTAVLTGTESVGVEAGTAVEIRVGRSVIRVSDARIEVVSPELVLRAEGASLALSDRAATLDAAADLALLGQRVMAKAAGGATLGLSSEAALDGAQVLLKSPTSAQDPAEHTAPPPTTLALTDQDGRALAWARYVVRLADGSARVGMLDRDGRATLSVQGDATVEFPDHPVVRAR
jgi:type VI secretion system secreted protein VgrG